MTIPETTAAIRLEAVSKTYVLSGRSQRVLDDIQLDIRPGEFVSLIGPSGCGKSTLLRLIAGLDPEHAGRILLEGARVDGPHPACGVLFQEHRLFPWLTVEDNVALGAYHEGEDKAAVRARVKEQLRRVNLGDIGQAFPQQLSGGMAQRVSIARMLMGSRRILLMDEPFSALDAFTRLKLQAELETLWQGSGITMLSVTHDIEEAVYLSDRIVVMEAHPGRIAEVVVNDCPRPRDRTSPEFAALKRRLFSMLHL